MKSTLLWCAVPVVAALSGLRWGGMPPQLLDRRTDWYREDAPQARPIAAITAELSGSADVAELTFTIDAQGAGVEPLPGLTGVAGANVRAAEELDRLFGDGALRVATRRVGDRAQVPGRIDVARRGRVPAHRLDRSGRMHWLAGTEAEYVLAVTATSASLPPGEHETFVFVHDMPRLRIVTTTGPGTARIDAIESLGEPGLLPRQP